MKIKSYKVFYTDVREHLINYLEKTQNGKTEGIIPGIWPNNGKEYKHILNIEKGKVLAIQSYNLLRGVSQLPFILEGKSLHQFAHHLNSSQVMCYNFFRPQLDDNKLVKEPLIKLLNDLGVIFDESNICAKADFEYEEPRTEEPDRWRAEHRRDLLLCQHHGRDRHRLFEKAPPRQDECHTIDNG